MATSPAAAGTWDEDPAGASIVLATGRARHDLLVIAEPALLTDLDDAWGRPASRVRLSFLPGVSAPGSSGQEDSLMSYDRGGLGVLVARGRTCLFEGRAARRTTAFARIAAGAGVRAALLVGRASSLGSPELGDLLAMGDHLNLSGTPLFPATGPVEATWDEPLTEVVAEVDGVSGSAVAALIPGPVRPGRAEAAVLGGLGADVVVMDTVAEAMALAVRGVKVAGLLYVDSIAGAPPRPGSGRRSAARAAGRRAAVTPPVGMPVAHRPAPVVICDVIEAALATLA